MKLYHFLSQKWGLEAIQRQRIKVSKFSDFNDPFELAAMSLENKKDREFVFANKEKLNSKLRVLCCSANWHSPLLWAHYADKHKGVALELEIPETHAEPISYRKSREKINIDELFSNPGEQEKWRFYKLCNTKYIEWGYEEEYRIQFTEDEWYSEADYDFYRLGDKIKITGLILGVSNKLTKQEIKAVVPVDQALSVITTRAAFQSFNIVQRKDKPIYTVNG